MAYKSERESGCGDPQPPTVHHMRGCLIRGFKAGDRYQSYLGLVSARIPPARTIVLEKRPLYELLKLRMVIHPSMTLLESAWPVDELWERTRSEPGAYDFAPRRAESRTLLQLAPLPDSPGWRRLDAGSFKFVEALTREMTLASAITIVRGFEIVSPFSVMRAWWSPSRRRRLRLDRYRRRRVAGSQPSGCSAGCLLE